MSSWKQLLAVVAAVVLLVGGLAFVYNSLNLKEVDEANRAPASGKDAKGAVLKFFSPQQRLEGELEVNTTGAINYYFQNPSERPMEARLDYKNCECTKVELAFLSDDEAKHLPNWPPSSPQVDSEPAVLKAKDRWHMLEKSGAPTTVPAKAKGALRLSWLGKKAGPHSAMAALITQFPDDPASEQVTRLDALAAYTPVMLADTTTLDVPMLDEDGTQAVSFNCWSPTRKHFKLDVTEEVRDPHFVCNIRPLGAQELKDVVYKEYEHKHTTAECKSGYRVTVTVFESAEGKRLNLGPYERKLKLVSDIMQEVPITVRGSVRGEVDVGDTDSNGIVQLGRFPADEGTSATVPLIALRPDVELEFLKCQPDYLQVKPLGRGTSQSGGRQWQLVVTVPPRIPPGRLPQGSEVVLRIKSKQPRELHIPVHGTAYE